MIVNCNACKEDFGIQIKSKRVNLDVEGVYFDCPHCGERYVAFYTDQKARDMQKDIRRRWEVLNQVKNLKEVVKQRDEISRVESKLEERMNKLKKRWTS